MVTLHKINQQFNNSNQFESMDSYYTNYITENPQSTSFFEIDSNNVTVKKIT